MLEKTIKKVLSRKISSWLDSIEDPVVRKKIEKNIVVTGGCFTSFLQNDKPKDYDVYLRTQESVIAVAEYYVKKFNKNHDNSASVIVESDLDLVGTFDPEVNPKEGYVYSQYTSRFKKNGRVRIFISSAGVAGQIEDNHIEDMELGADPVEEIAKKENEEVKEKFLPVFLSSNAITLSEDIQVVVRFYGDPEKIHETYDFVHTKAYWTTEEKVVVIPKEVYEAVLNKTLIYTGSKYPVCSVVRMRKFINRGWRINAGQILKMAMQISALDLTNIDVLEDQLIGVDSLYFTMLIEKFREKLSENKDFKIDGTYVGTLIDRLM